MRRLQSLKLALAALILTAAGGGDALAQATIDVIAPEVQAVNQNFTVSFNYALDGGTWDDFVLTMALPAGVTLKTSSHPGTLQHACTGAAPNIVCTWSASSLAVENTGVSGSIQLTMILDRFKHPSGSTVALSGTLTAAYTNNAGTAQSVSIGPEVASITATASAALRWHDNGLTSVDAHFMPGPGTSGTGYYYIYDFRWRNEGTARIETGAKLTVKLAPGVVFVDAWERCDNSVLPKEGCGQMTVATTLTGWEPAGAGATVTATMNRPLGRNDAIDYSTHLHIAVWVPCEGAIPTGDTDAAYLTTAAVAGVEATVDSTIDRALVTPASIPPPGPVTNAPACGSGEVISKTHYSGVSPGVSHVWTLSVTPPKGQLVFDDAIVIDKIPAGTSLGAWSDVQSSGFTAYSCALPEEDNDFTTAQFLDYVASGSCAVWSGAPLANATHAVWYAETWGSAAGIEGFSVRVYTNVPRDYVAQGGAPSLVNDMVVHVGEVGSEEIAFEGSRKASFELGQGSRPYMRVVNDPRNNGPTTLQPGDTGTVVFSPFQDPNWQRAENYTVTVDVDARVQVISATTEFRNVSQCIPWNPASDAWTGPSTLGNSLTWEYGTAEKPTYLQNLYFAGCVLQVVKFKVPEEGAFANGDKITLTSHVTAVDEDPSNPRGPLDARFTLAVPGEMRMGVAPACQDGGQPAFVATASNTGGTDLNALVADVSLPGFLQDDPSTATATFAGIDGAPAGASFLVSADGAAFVAEGAIPNADVKVVRMTYPTLPALSDPLTFRVLLATVSTSGTLHARAVLSAAELEPADSQFSAAFEVNTCPGTLTILKFWDADHDGVQDTGEAALEGWSFEVSDGLTTAVFGPTGADGLVSGALSPGEYTVTELLPASDGTWETPVGGFARTVTVAPAGDTLVSFGNVCSCADPTPGECSGVACQADGSCVTVPLDGTACDTGDVCTTGDVCVQGTCTAGAALDCGDGDSCTTDVCVQGFGCQSTGPTCDEVVFGLLVTDATGDVAGVVRCMASATGPPSCDNDGGVLTVYAPGSQGYDPALFQCVPGAL